MLTLTAYRLMIQRLLGILFPLKATALPTTHGHLLIYDFGPAVYINTILRNKMRFFKKCFAM